MFAGRYPHKVHKLVLAGSPVDLGAAGATMVDAVRATRPEVFEAVVESGQGLVLCRRALDLWPHPDLDDARIARILQSDRPVTGDLVAKFRQWHRWTLNLPGVYYLQVVEDLYRHNRLAQGEFRALGRKLDLSVVQAPVYLLAGQEDAIVPPEQVLGAVRLVGTPPTSLRAAVAPCGHLSLFMGATDACDGVGAHRPVASVIPASKDTDLYAGSKDRFSAEQPADEGVSGHLQGGTTQGLQLDCTCVRLLKQRRLGNRMS